MRLLMKSAYGFTLGLLISSLAFIGTVLFIWRRSCYTGSILQYETLYSSRSFSVLANGSWSNDTDNNNTNTINTSQEINYRTRFIGLWEKLNPSIGLDFLEDARKYMIYRCGPGMLGCGGWADRVKGMIIGYLMANLTGRVFKIDFRDPECDITNALIPNRVDWRLPRPFHTVVKFDNPPPDAVVLDYFRHPGDLRDFDKTNVSQIFNQSIPYVYMKANLDYVDKIKRTSVYQHRLAWMNNLRKDQIFSEFYKRLFRLSPEVQKRLEHFLAKHLPTPQHKLICGHIRMGQNPDIPNAQEQVRMKPEFLPNVWNFFSRHSVSDLDKIFIMTDSNDTMREARNQSFAHRLISTHGNILHMDYSHKSDTELRCEAMEKVIFDQAVLMNCDVLLISKSGLSRMAAFVRASDEGLYCLFPWGVITKCQSDQFTQLYHISG